MRLKAAAGDSLTPAAIEAFERAAEKSAVVLERHPDSGYVDDALLLLGRSLDQLGSDADAAATFRRYLSLFGDAEGAFEARVALARAERRLEDFEAAEAALGPLLLDPRHATAPEILYEKALIELGTGAHSDAVATFREILERHPDFARREGIALRFADAELAAGQVDAALEAYAAFRASAADPLERRTVALRTARALALAGRSEEAMETYGDVLAGTVPDSLAARVELERGELLAAASEWEDAEAAFRRVAELSPGSQAAARATLARGRILWHVRRERAEALDVLLDAFLHSPASIWADSARSEARGLARLLHYRGLAEGEAVAAGLEDPALVRATALYRYGEEMLELEDDPAAAAAVFARIADQYPDSPWRPRALLASGILRRRSGEPAAGEAALRRLIEEYPDTPEADSARHALGLEIPPREAPFYGASSELQALASALPAAPDPMERVVDQLDRYVDRPEPAAAGRGGVGRGGQPGAPPGPGEPILGPGEPAPGPGEPLGEITP